MKKWLMLFVILSVGFVLFVYVFIPSELKIAQVVTIGTTINGSNRVLLDPHGWNRWWPQKDIQKGDSLPDTYYYNGFCFQLTEKLYNQFIVKTTTAKRSYSGRLVTLPSSSDSLKVYLQYEFTTSKNFITRIEEYQQARKLSRSAKEILGRLKTYLEQTENIYGVHIAHTATPKTFLVAETISHDHYPSTQEIYQMIQSLEHYVSDEQAVVTGKPMVNITQTPAGVYEAMVAIPVNRELKGNEKIIMRKIVTVKALLAKVTGGNKTIQKTIEELYHYANDYKLFSPAIPYESLVTDRLKEPDSAKWVTEIYLPLL